MNPLENNWVFSMCHFIKKTIWPSQRPKYPYYNVGSDTRKSVFRVSDKVRFKPACSATETSKRIEISLVASLDMILSST